MKGVFKYFIKLELAVYWFRDSKIIWKSLVTYNIEFLVKTFRL